MIDTLIWMWSITWVGHVPVYSSYTTEHDCMAMFQAIHAEDPSREVLSVYDSDTSECRIGVFP